MTNEVTTRETKVLSFSLTIMKTNRITPSKTINNGMELILLND